MDKENGILLGQCADQKGILAAICDFINKNNGNIVSLNEFADTHTNTFFTRVEWELKGFNLATKEDFKEAFTQSVGQKFNMQIQAFSSINPTKTALFVSKYTHCIEDLLYRYQNGELAIEIPLIISNHDDLRYLAERYNIPYYVFPMSSKNKQEQEAKQLKLLKEHGVELIVLARYMQILSPHFVAQYKNQIINIHHSFLPAFAGAKPYHAAYKRGVKIIGATAHIVTSDLDEGPIICQDVIKTTHRDAIQDMIQKGRDVERAMLSKAVKLFTNHQVIVTSNKTIVFE